MKNFANEVVKAINARGTKAEVQEINKNGVQMVGAVIGDGTVRATVYLNGYFEQELSAEETATKVLEFVEREKDSRPTEDIAKDFQSAEFVLPRLRVTANRAGAYMDCIRYEDYGITFTMVVRIDIGAIRIGAIRVKPEHLKLWGVDEQELWKRAWENTEDVKISSLIGFMYGKKDEPAEDGEPLVVVTNESTINGASAVFTKKAKQFLRELWGVDKAIVIPSSIHETIVVNPQFALDIKELAQMVKAVNAETVSPIDQLADAPFEIAL